jgi:glycerol-3-phosphate acyltransferase PlsY
MALVLVCVAAWLLGGIPWGLVLVRLLRGVDIRTIGSGNIGATNASRAFAGAARRAVFLAIYALDFLKGFLPAWLAPLATGDGHWAPVLAGAAAILGHVFSPYLAFRGGKGVATTTGVVAALEPIALLAALLVFAVVLRLSRQVYVASLGLGLALAVATVLRSPSTAFGARLPVTLLAAAVALFLFWTHRDNLRGISRRRDPAEARP